jgi:hypothetical protein
MFQFRRGAIIRTTGCGLTEKHDDEQESRGRRYSYICFVQLKMGVSHEICLP